MNFVSSGEHYQVSIPFISSRKCSITGIPFHRQLVFIYEVHTVTEGILAGNCV
jgi:hypothetical protein